jgi:hypothetical protein
VEEDGGGAPQRTVDEKRVGGGETLDALLCLGGRGGVGDDGLVVADELAERLQGFGFRVSGLRFRVSGFGSRV